jgi:hypothetical protein
MIIYMLIGALLAQRFKVLVLFPAITLTGLSSALVSYHSAVSSWQIVGTVIVDIICLQVGYLAGAGIYHLLVARLVSAFHRGASISPHRAAP